MVSRGRFLYLVVLWIAGAIALAFATVICRALDFNVAAAGFTYLVVIVLLSLLDSFISSAIFSVIAFGCLNYFFMAPLYTFEITDLRDVVALIAFIVTSLAITTLVRRVKHLVERQRKQLETLMRAEVGARKTQETFLAEAQQLSHTGSFGWNTATGKILWSDESFRIFDYDPTIVPTMPLIYQRMHPEDVSAVQEAVDRAIKNREDFNIEHRLLLPGGTVKHLRVVARALINEEGELQFMGALMDVTAQRNSEEALRSSERRYRHLFDFMPMGVWQLNPAGLGALFKEMREQGVTDLSAYLDQKPDFLYRIMEALPVEDVNEYAIKMFGARDRSELLGPCTFYWKKRPDTFRRAMESRFRGEPTYQEETQFITLDGREIDVLFTAARLGTPSGIALSLVGLIDISDRVRAQERLQRLQAEFAHASRISVLGELAASIAHEVNQPLATITTNGEAGLRWLSRAEPNVPKALEIMQRVVDDSQRAADIISRIRTMAAGRAPKHAELSLNEVIQESILFLQREFQSNGVQVSVDLQPLGMQVRITGDRTQLQQVFVNLAINAVHAMAQSSSARRLLLIQSKLADSETVCCTIEDSGPGIDPGHQSRLFDGFFTTKESGMGMGLPISRSIIEAHGGIISADNQSVHGGARFKFKLPITRTIVQ